MEAVYLLRLSTSFHNVASFNDVSVRSSFESSNTASTDKDSDHTYRVGNKTPSPDQQSKMGVAK